MPPKSLPDIPANSSIPRFTPDALYHIRAIVRYQILQRELPLEWSFALSSALEHLIEWLTSSDHLQSIYSAKRARKWHSEHIREARDSSTGSRASQMTVKPDEHKDRALERIQEFLQDKAASDSRANHLLLTVDPPTILPTQDMDFDVVPSQLACTFRPLQFPLPFFDNLAGIQCGSGGRLLCGLDFDITESFNIVGGSFIFTEVVSISHYEHLVHILRISVFTILSLGLELALFRDSSIYLDYSRTPSPPPPLPPPHDSSTGHRARVKARVSRAKSGIWSYLTKHTENLLYRSRAGPLDLANRLKGVGEVNEDDSNISPFLGLQSDARFYRSALTRAMEAQSALSTSPGVQFTPPILLTELAKREEMYGSANILGGETLGLASILGWESNGKVDFMAHQNITLLYSEYVPAIKPTGSVEEPTNRKLASCLRGRWETYCYYATRKDMNSAISLGEYLDGVFSNADQSCNTPDCKFSRKEHELRWIHDRTMITASVENGEDTPERCIWVSCAVCKSTTDRHRVSEGASLISFGKYLELLIYSPHMACLSDKLCEHTRSPSQSDQPLELRHNLLHHFSQGLHIVTLATAPVPDVFEVRIPRLQIRPPNPQSTTDLSWQQQERDKLRIEITMWWKGVKEHLTQLEEYFEDAQGHMPWRKALPPSPPPEEESADTATPKANPKALPPTLPSASSTSSTANTSPPVPSTTSSLSSLSDDGSPLALLRNLRLVFQAAEQSLYKNLNNSPVSSINDTRRLFQASGKAASKRLSAWQSKHAPDARDAVADIVYSEPEWWADTCHALPGGSVLVREGEWGSIIAFTLSSTDYLSELSSMSMERETSTTGATAGSTRSTITTDASTLSTEDDHVVSLGTTPTISATSSRSSSLVNVQAPSPAVSGRTDSTLDPDDETQADRWHTPESWSSQISRKDHPKDGSTILSIRDALWNANSLDSSSISSRFTSIGSSASKVIRAAPPSAWAKPAVEITTDVADGSLIMQNGGVTTATEKLLKDVGDQMQKQDNEFVESMTSKTLKPTQRQEKPLPAPYVTGQTSEILDSTIPPPLPPKESAATSLRSESRNGKQTARGTTSEKDSTTHTDPKNLDYYSVGSLTSTIANAMRYVLSGTQEATSNKLAVPYSSHHGLLAVDSAPIDEKPHIKYEWTIGSRLKFSCTVYYARQFHSIRQRCGVGEELVQSLKRSDNWTAEGGKSKSNFWKTSDDRFIIKTLLNAWNVADLQVLIDLGPAYFRYVDSTAQKPSLLAKLLGFYTVEIKNMETGTVQSKADLLVMENLFFEKNISRTFDLKGIQGRKVKPSGSSGGSGKTLFDREWIEGQTKALMLLRPHSKLIFQEAIQDDAEFLAKANIMDYSLLLGIDDDKKELVCGLVDTIGSFTFAKTLEYKAKQNIRKDVTVIPPNEYRDRFIKAMETYFLACPDKWSRPSADFEIPTSLPDVL